MTTMTQGDFCDYMDTESRAGRGLSIILKHETVAAITKRYGITDDVQEYVYRKTGDEVELWGCESVSSWVTNTWRRYR